MLTRVFAFQNCFSYFILENEESTEKHPTVKTAAARKRCST